MVTPGSSFTPTPLGPEDNLEVKHHPQVNALQALRSSLASGCSFPVESKHRHSLAKIRLQQEISLAIAFSGIVVTLLDGGQTTYSALKLPLDIHKKPSTMGTIEK
ncbi:hypothetical protein TNCV_2460161 [Trichonephila clavipes]|nr:hypothetical protein TNCV_2460161 [Trichonephila clavipes]